MAKVNLPHSPFRYADAHALFWIIIFGSCLSGSYSLLIRSVVLPYECSPELLEGECKWSNWTRTCFWPQSDIESSIKNFTEELHGHGCQIPKNEFANGALNRRINIILSTTLLKRVQQLKPCGACSFRLRCCNKAPDFLRQSFDAFQCTGGTFAKACIVDGLTQEELDVHREKHPDWPHISGDACDFNQLFPLHRVRGTDATSHLLQRLLCSFYGTSRPVITCTKLSNFRCQCCCSGFVPTNDGYCVTDPSPSTDPICQRDETDTASCLGQRISLN